MSLNTEQQALYDKIVCQNFSKLLLLGDAGTGKTYTLCKAISALVRNGNMNLILCAPTHLARLNILSKLDNDIQHLVETSTVASLLLKFGVDREDGTTQFTQGKIDKVNKYSLIALDECSMISEQDYMLFMTSKAKIVFTGDMAQLPPVMARSAEGKMNSHTNTGNLEVFRLVKQMRQQGVIHQAAERNRKSAWFPDSSETGEGGESITVHRSENEMVEKMISNILSDKRGYLATYDHRYIAFRNDQVREKGKKIRDRVLEKYFGFDASSIPFICNEIIMMRENKGSIGFNGELVEIVNVRKDSRSNNYPWQSYELTVKGSIGTGLIRTVPPCQYKIMDEYIERLQGKLRGYQIEKRFEDANLVLTEIKRIKGMWTSTQYPYAITTHKSQGSTIENVYLNTLSFVKASNKRALLYVGISRAKDNLHVVKVPDSLKVNGAKVVREYRQAKEEYERVFRKPFTDVVRNLGVPANTLEGKQIVTGYLQALVDDAGQE
jgi:ATP-dependent exoDNAse (exonuclease V) alpha subunit